MAWCNLMRDLVSTWWRVDRIRCSPREGRVLRIVPGSVLQIGDRQWQVTHRLVRDTHDRPLVGYRAVGPAGDAELWVDAQAPQQLLWIMGAQEHQLLADELQIWGPDALR